MSLSKKATLIALSCAFLLAIIKLIAGILSASVAMFSSAMDSLMDFMMSGLNFLALKKASQKANSKYNFGFSKIEALVGLFEGACIVLMGVFIAYESLSRFFEKQELLNLDLALWVMGICIVCNFFLVLFLESVSKKTKNLVVSADCLHYKTDLLSNVFTLIALVLVFFTKFYFIDALFGMILSLYIIFSACKIIKKSVEILMDKALDEAEIEKIIEIIRSNPNVLSFHDLKTRVTPNANYIIVHLVLSPTISLEKAHEIGDMVENQINETLENSKIEIHFDIKDDSKKD